MEFDFAQSSESPNTDGITGPAIEGQNLGQPTAPEKPAPAPEPTPETPKPPEQPVPPPESPEPPQQPLPKQQPPPIEQPPAAQQPSFLPTRPSSPSIDNDTPLVNRLPKNAREAHDLQADILKRKRKL